MSDYWSRVSAIRQQQNAAGLAQQDAAIGRATDFWNRVEGIQNLEQQRNGAYHEFQSSIGHNPDVPVPLHLQPGNTPSEMPKIASSSKSGSGYSSGYSGGNSGSALGVAYSSVPPSVVDYLNADLAKHYGMSKETAYQEALENTSYQRAMKDMKDAGLNPAVMFGSGRAHGAGSSVGIYNSGGGYGSGGSGGYSRRSGGSSKKGQLFSSSAYGAISAIGGLIGIAATGRPDGFWIGSAVTGGAMHLLNAIHQR